MEVVILVIALAIGVLIGLFVGINISHRRLHTQTTGALVFDSTEPTNAPYLCFESYDELAEVRTKKYATLRVDWTNGNSPK